MTLVKVDGISEAKHARAAAAFGVDFVGIIFAPSKRQVTIGQARQVASALRKGRGRLRPGASAAELEEAVDHGRPLLVGVFADQDADTINAIAEECGLDIVQLSGFEPWEMCRMIDHPVFKCMKVKQGDDASIVAGNAGDGAILLLDAYVSGTYGGTGQKLDWDVAAAVAKLRPTVLAGGLTPENVGDAIRIVRPWAVDVSSGIESDGAKDVDKIRSFIAAAKEAGNE